MFPTKDVSKFDYLRHRPFLVIETFIEPPSDQRAKRKGWKAHHTYSEKPRMLYRIGHTTMRTAMVIIDVVHDTVIKNRLSGTGMRDADVLAHYKKKHSDSFAAAMQQWMFSA